jgi:putative inorganic carbon (hco3(-)) transporter
MFLDHPLMGVGPGNFGVWFPDYYLQYGSKSAGNMWGRVAHSLYFTLLPELGITGVLLFVGLLWHNFKDHKYLAALDRRKEEMLSASSLSLQDQDAIRGAIRKLHFLSLGYSGALIGYLVTGAFIAVLWYGYFWTLTAFWVATANAGRKIEDSLLMHVVQSSPETVK